MPYVDLHSTSSPAWTTGPRRWRRPSGTPAGWTPRASTTSPAPRTSSAPTSRTSTSRARRPARGASSARSTPTACDVRLHPGGELAHEDALELDERELELIAQGPAHAPWLLLECPFEGLDDDFDAAVERLTGARLRPAARAPGAHLRRARAARPHVEAGALLQVNVSSLLGDHGPRAREIAARSSARARVLPRLRHPPRHARAHAPARRRRAAPPRRQRRPGVPAHAVQSALPPARGQSAPGAPADEDRAQLHPLNR